MNNLISNALKYTEKGKIEFGYTLKMEEGIQKLQFFVSDTGSGITEKEFTHIFSRFYKVNGRNNTNRGVGLGLAIVKQLIEKMDGKIWIDSELGKGSTFYFTIPYEETHVAVSEVQNVNDSIVLKGMTVLVAEDDDGNFYLTKLLLKRIGVTVLRAQNGVEAVDICMKNYHNLDFVLMDQKMPIMDGVEAVMKIREFEKDLLIFALSAHVMVEAKDSALKAGCNDFISKPIEEEKFLTIVKRHLYNKQ